MGNIFCCCTRGWGSNVPQATETTTDQPRSHSQNVTNQSVSTGSRSYYSAHSSPRTESYRGGARMMDGDQDTTRRRLEEHDDGSCQDVSPAVMNGVSTEITEEISPSQHERWRDLVLDIQFRAQEDDFLTANGSFTPTPSPVSKRLTFSPMASPRIGRRVGSMSPSSANLKNAFNFKNRNNNADIEEGVALVFDGREKSNVPRTWSLTNLLTPRKSKKTESLPATPLAHSNPESMHGSYAFYDQFTSTKRERTLPIRTLPIRRTRSVPTLIHKDGNMKPSCLLRVIPTPSRVDMHEHDDGGEDVPGEEAVCSMVELGKDSEAFKMECM
ncbi:hypothetical protein F2Q68_00023484 [Brassica cretica]|nr:hypothetical protein F2Q68_00023484 [Brassica cretica]